MNITPIGNNPAHFQARFSNLYLQRLTKEAVKENTPEALPKLYTLLEHFDGIMPGVRAKLGYSNELPFTPIRNAKNDKLIGADYYSYIQALKNICVNDKFGNSKSYSRMTKDVFEKKLQANSNVTIEDINKFSSENMN